MRYPLATHLHKHLSGADASIDLLTPQAVRLLEGDPRAGVWVGHRDVCKRMPSAWTLE